MAELAELIRPALLGARLEGECPDRWTPERLTELRRLVDERLVLHITCETPVTPEALAALAQALGCPKGPWPDAPGGLPGYGFIADIKAAAKPDDGRPRVARWIETLHFDGPSAYSVQATLEGTPVEPNLWVDMRAVWVDLPTDLQKVLANHQAQVGLLPPTSATLEMFPPLDPERARRAPLAIRHPKTGETVLRPPKSPHSAIEGLPLDEGRAILAEVWSRVAASPHRYEALPRPGDIILWEGVALAHTNPAFPRGEDRRVWFFTAPGDWSGFERAAP
jgi:alpha-ketoglutarate-dependent taurine dioxygenase